MSRRHPARTHVHALGSLAAPALPSPRGLIPHSLSPEASRHLPTGTQAQRDPHRPLCPDTDAQGGWRGTTTWLTQQPLQGQTPRGTLGSSQTKLLEPHGPCGRDTPEAGISRRARGGQPLPWPQALAMGTILARLMPSHVAGTSGLRCWGLTKY